MSYFPMMVELEGCDVLVVGGGNEGESKVRILKQFGAVITLVSPSATNAAIEHSDIYICRDYADGDIAKGRYRLVVASTDDRELNRRIYDECTRYAIPVNVVDDVELCTFIFPAIIKEREVVCSVSSGGKSPLITQRRKALIRNVLPEGIGEINDRMGEYRAVARQEYSDRTERRRFLSKKLDELLGKR